MLEFLKIRIFCRNGTIVMRKRGNLEFGMKWNGKKIIAIRCLIAKVVE